jgi:hypothetical protein
VFFLIAASLVLCGSPRPARAQETPAPFAYAWTIFLGEKEIGSAASRFVPDAAASGISLVETGKREFLTGFGPFSVHFREETEVVWDGSGLMTSFVSRGGVNDRLDTLTASRAADGAVTWKRVRDGRAVERTFLAGDFDYTDGDRFLTRLVGADEAREFRIVSLSKGRICRMRYRFLGWETVTVGERTIRAARIGTDGQGGEGIVLIDDLGIAVSLTIETLFGDFSFVPRGPGPTLDGPDRSGPSGR